MTFEETDRLYAELKRRHQEGALTDEEFDARLKELMVQDDAGRWWAKSRGTGDWHYHDGHAWVKGTPPARDQNRRQHQATRRWIMVAAPFAALVLIVAILGFVTSVGDDQSANQPSNPGNDRSAGQSSNPEYVFKDDFSQTSTGWDQTKEDLYGSYYDEGRYRVYITSGKSGNTRWSLSDVEIPDQGAIVEVDATRAKEAPSGPSSNWGIMCRANDNDGNGYLMGISDSGYPIIQRVKDFTLTTLERNDSYVGYAILENGSTNHIRGACVANKLTLYVNDKKVLEAEDSELGSGSVGVYVQDAGVKPPGTDVYFDNFRVGKP